MKELLQNLLKLQELEFAEASDSATEAAIAKLRRKIPLPILEHYDRLTDRGKKGVAIVRHQVCMGCHMRIPIGAIITLMHGDGHPNVRDLRTLPLFALGCAQRTIGRF